ncbi:hypothetical protein G7068_08280 [Leucobacter viscericola]|uniref:Uncharacterized protein n=1 Tax=Leucobacter viscericola TaxID=2714935 RepID=A0A6G7XFA7_9MICO|nr:hypothetical protein [Leucobacter viscericola]QIK63192.1 hypothetical protein G7068_08280 [Leucobacter viscericola]
MISLARKELLREQAARAMALKLSVGSLARTGQIERSSVEVGDETVNVGEAVASVPEVADVVLSHSEDLAVLDPIYDLTDQTQSLEDATHDASMIGIENSVAVEEALEAAEKAIADAAVVSEFAEGVSATAEAIRVEAEAARNAASLAQREAAEATQSAIDRAAEAERAAKEFAEAQAEQARSDANDETARAVAEAKAAAAADAKAKADTAELAAKTKAAEALAAADAAALAAAQADSKATQAREDALRNARYRMGPDAVYAPPMPEGGFRLGAQLVRVDEGGRPFQVDRWNGMSWVRDQILADQVLVAGEGGTVQIADGMVTAEALASSAIDGKVITGATIRTAESGQRLQLDVTGLRVFKAKDIVTAALSSEEGGLALTGALSSTNGKNTTTLDSGLISVNETINKKTVETQYNSSGIVRFVGLGAANSNITFDIATPRGASNRIKLDSEAIVLDSTGISSTRGLKSLWTGASYMSGTQAVNLLENINAQLTGVVLAWSAYADGVAANSSWNYVFVPKSHVVDAAGSGVLQTIYGWKSPVWKYVYISNNRITGHADNTVAPANTQVLRAVYGI